MAAKKTVIWSIIAFAVLAGIVYFSYLRKPKVQYETADVQKSTVTQTVSASGTLMANDDVGLNFETPGRIKEVDIDVGQKVGKGDVLAILDQKNLQLDVDQARANLEKARADAGVTSDSIHTAEVAVDNAQKALNDTKNLNDANVAQAEKKTSDAKEYLDDAKTYYDQVKADKGDGSSEAKLAKLTVDTGESNYNGARKAEDVAAEQADLSETEAENTLAYAKANLNAAKSRFIAEGNNATVANFQAQYESALANLDKAVLHAPISGVIKQVNFKAGEVIGSPSITSQTSVFAEMISYDLIFEAQVPESDINKIALGQTASLTFDSFSVDEKFSGKVISIEPSATVVQDVVDYVVKIALDSVDSRMKDGMSADVDFQIAKKDNVLNIPERAVQGENGSQNVQVLNPKGQAEKRDVKTGLKGDGGVIEIISGLSEGEKVVTATK